MNLPKPSGLLIILCILKFFPPLTFVAASDTDLVWKGQDEACRKAGGGEITESLTQQEGSAQVTEKEVICSQESAQKISLAGLWMVGLKGKTLRQRWPLSPGLVNKGRSSVTTMEIKSKGRICECPEFKEQRSIIWYNVQITSHQSSSHCTDTTFLCCPAPDWAVGLPTWCMYSPCFEGTHRLSGEDMERNQPLKKKKSHRTASTTISLIGNQHRACLKSSIQDQIIGQRREAVIGEIYGTSHYPAKSLE